MLTVDDLRNPRLKNGFHYIANDGQPPHPYRAQCGKGRTHGPQSGGDLRWHGPRRLTVEEAAQDYCD